MDTTQLEDLLQKGLKTFNEAEAQQVLDIMAGLNQETRELVVSTGEQFRASSTVNGAWFYRTLPSVVGILGTKNLERWLSEGRIIARGNWESCLAFLKHTPDTLKELGEASYLDWVQIGKNFLRFSSQDAAWFFKNAETYLRNLPEAGRLEITKFVLSTIECAWSAALASFKVLPDLISQTDHKVAKTLFDRGNEVISDFPEVAAEYFLALPSFLVVRKPEDLTTWVKMAEVFPKQNSHRQLISNYFKYTPDLLVVADKDAYFSIDNFSNRLGQWASWGNSLGCLDPKLAEAFFKQTPSLLKKLRWEFFDRFVELVKLVEKVHSAEGALSFINNSSEILEELDIQELQEWVNFGLYNQKYDNRLAYFSIKSQESRDAIIRFRRGLHLDSVKKVLLFYCEGLTGEKVKIRPSTDLPGKIHGEDRLFCSLDTQRIYLPIIVKTDIEDKVNLELYKGMIMHQVAHRQFGTFKLKKGIFRELANNEELGLLFELIEDCRVEQLAAIKFPGLTKIFSQQSVSKELKDYLGMISSSKQDEVKTLIDEFLNKVTLNGASAEESLLLARMILALADKKFLQENAHRFPNHSYRGKLKYELIYMSIALDEENQKGVSVSETGFVSTDRFSPHKEFYLRLKKLLAEFLEDEENPYRLTAYYDEWDRTLNDFKKDWCKVREILLKPSTARFVEKTLRENYGMINTLKRYFGMLRPDRFRRYKRQAEGDDIDIDAVIEAMVERKAGTSSPGGFYIRRDKRERDVAVAFLMDLSYSTNEVIPGGNKTLLELEQEAVIVMAEALEVLGDKYAIYGFTSDGREKINFYVVKDFEEAYTLEVKQKFGGLKSYGMTRLAAAVRHATNKLEHLKAAIKILIILSDGRPFDFDYHSGLTKDYEEYYAEADTRMALRETKMKGINPFCITIDSKGQDYMSYIYGNVNYIIIDNVNHLPIKLTEIYKNLTS